MYLSLGQVELIDGPKDTAIVDKSPQSRPKVFFSTEFDVIATDGLECGSHLSNVNETSRMTR